MVAVKRNQVRIGINAPKDVAVYREEVFDRVQTENKRSKWRQGVFVLTGVPRIQWTRLWRFP